MLLGRRGECTRVDSLLDGARAGRSAALLLRGEAGIGKTSLLRYAVERAARMRVLETRGVEFESNLPFAGLPELLRRVLGRIDDPPDSRAGALRGALALGPPAAGDRFAVYAATLSLLAAAAEREPVLVVV